MTAASESCQELSFVTAVCNSRNFLKRVDEFARNLSSVTQTDVSIKLCYLILLAYFRVLF